MLYIHQTYCISPQQTYTNIVWNTLYESKNNRLSAIEPVYENISRNTLRRMGKSARMGIGAAYPIIQQYPKIDGIIIGTATAGKDDSFIFLNQVMEYDEGLLTPANFVQGTSNTVASQIGISSKNNSYNITHVHEGLAFENSLIDAMMQLQENSNKNILVGSVDEISDHDFNLNNLAGDYKKEIVSNEDLFNADSSGSLAGEGSALFLVNNSEINAGVKIEHIKPLFTNDEQSIQNEFEKIIKEYLSNEGIDIFISGENGDVRYRHFYNALEILLSNETSILRFKHLCGEYPTASAFATFLACNILKENKIPAIAIKKSGSRNSYKNILIYNNYRGKQHSFILMKKVGFIS
jgi:hypothetical protein